MQAYRGRDDVRFVVVYQREPHAGQMAFDQVPQPCTRDERVALARKVLEEERLDLDLWVDDLGDQSRAAFGDLPNSAIVIDPLGTIRLKLSWCEPEVLALTLPEILATLPAERPAPADAGFLAEVVRPSADGARPDVANARHHRWTMLAHLAATRPEDAARRGWLAELVEAGPPEQRAWARQALDALRSSAASQPAKSGGS